MYRSAETTFICTNNVRSKKVHIILTDILLILFKFYFHIINFNLNQNYLENLFIVINMLKQICYSFVSSKNR